MAIMVKNQDYIQALKEAVQFTGNDNVEYLQYVHIWTEPEVEATAEGASTGKLVVFASEGHAYYKQVLHFDVLAGEEFVPFCFALDAGDIKVVAAEAAKTSKHSMIEVIPSQRNEVRGKEMCAILMQRKREPVEYKIGVGGVMLPTRSMATIMTLFARRVPKRDPDYPCKMTAWWLCSTPPDERTRKSKGVLYVFTNERGDLEIGCMPLRGYEEVFA